MHSEIDASRGDYAPERPELPPELRPPVVVERPQGSGVYVRLNDSYLRSIVYIGTAKEKSETEIEPKGTGFLVSHDGHSYLVTAAHVAVDFQDAAMDLRLNRDDTGLGGIEHVDTAKWYWHPDDKIDVAVMPFEPPKWARVHHFKKHFATDFKIGTKNFGTGDLAYVVGMFSKMQGKEKNVPVVHTGHVGSMGANEKLVADDWREGHKGQELEVTGFLIQAPTLPGASGSPVFVRRTLELRGMVEVDENGMNPSTVRAWTYGSVWLLGLWSAYWDDEDERGRTIGVGMGVCVPAQRILEVLDRKELKTMRDKAKEKEAQRTKLTLQKTKRPTKSSKSHAGVNPNHREDFDRLLTKAVTPKK